MTHNHRLAVSVFFILHVTSPNFRNGKTRIMLLSTSELTIFKFAITRRNGKMEVPIETKRIFVITKEMRLQNSERYFYGSRYYPCHGLPVTSKVLSTVRSGSAYEQMSGLSFVIMILSLFVWH